MVKMKMVKSITHSMLRDCLKIQHKKLRLELKIFLNSISDMHFNDSLMMRSENQILGLHFFGLVFYVIIGIHLFIIR